MALNEPGEDPDLPGVFRLVEKRRDHSPAETHRGYLRGTDGDRPKEALLIDAQTFEIRAAPNTWVGAKEIQDGLLRAGGLDALAAGGHELVAEKKPWLDRPEAEPCQSGRESMDASGRNGDHTENAFRDKPVIRQCGLKGNIRGLVDPIGDLEEDQSIERKTGENMKSLEDFALVRGRLLDTEFFILFIIQ